MKVAVVGTGAMGSVYAALMGDSGNEVWAIDAWDEHINTIKSQGLRLEGASGERTVKLNASTNAADAGECDLVIIATKAAHVEAAAKSAMPLVNKDTTVLTIQNGLGSADRVRNIMGDINLSIGVVGGFGASVKGPGTHTTTDGSWCGWANSMVLPPTDSKRLPKCGKAQALTSELSTTFTK